MKLTPDGQGRNASEYARDLVLDQDVFGAVVIHPNATVSATEAAQQGIQSYDPEGSIAFYYSESRNLFSGPLTDFRVPLHVFLIPLTICSDCSASLGDPLYYGRPSRWHLTSELAICIQLYQLRKHYGVDDSRSCDSNTLRLHRVQSGALQVFGCRTSNHRRHNLRTLVIPTLFTCSQLKSSGNPLLTAHHLYFLHHPCVESDHDALENTSDTIVRIPSDHRPSPHSLVLGFALLQSCHFGLQCADDCQVWTWRLPSVLGSQLGKIKAQNPLSLVRLIVKSYLIR